MKCSSGKQTLHISDDVQPTNVTHRRTKLVYSNDITDERTPLMSAFRRKPIICYDMEFNVRESKLIVCLIVYHKWWKRAGSKICCESIFVCINSMWVNEIDVLLQIMSAQCQGSHQHA